MTKIQKELALKLLDIGVVQFDFEKGWRLKLHEIHPEAPLSPFYIDLRIIRSHPEIMEETVRIYEKLLKDIKFDLLADVPTAATPIVSVLSQRLRVPMISPRIDQKVYGRGVKVEGAFKEGQTVVLIDDLITKADSKLEAIKILEKNGLKVRDVIVLVDREQGGKEELERRGYNLQSAFKISDFFKIYLQTGRLNQEQYLEVTGYLQKGGKV